MEEEINQEVKNPFKKGIDKILIGGIIAITLILLFVFLIFMFDTSKKVNEYPNAAYPQEENNLNINDEIVGTSANENVNNQPNASIPPVTLGEREETDGLTAPTGPSSASQPEFNALENIPTKVYNRPDISKIPLL